MPLGEVLPRLPRSCVRSAANTFRFDDNLLTLTRVNRRQDDLGYAFTGGLDIEFDMESMRVVCAQHLEVAIHIESDMDAACGRVEARIRC